MRDIKSDSFTFMKFVANIHFAKLFLITIMLRHKVFRTNKVGRFGTNRPGIMS